jgi:ribose transport system permease protein
MNGVDLTSSRVNAASTPDAPSRRSVGGGWRRRLSVLSVTNVGVIYVLMLLIVVFSLWAPSTFPTWTTAKSVLNGSAIPGLMALALVLPLSARQFDLSIGNAMGLANMLVAWLIVNHSWGLVPAIVATVLAGLAMGLFNGVIVVLARIDSFIGTLATGSVLATIATALSDQSIIGNQLSGTFSKIATVGIAGIELPALLAVVVAAALWFVQKYTPLGRRIYALGFNDRGAELVGIGAKRLKFGCLVVSSGIAGIAGVLLASSVSSGSPGIGDAYLLNAYTAVFLGATQFGQRFNAWGTVWSVVLLNTGTNGIFLVGGPAWAQTLFTGVVLLLALGASSLEQAIRVRSWVRAKATSAGSHGLAGVAATSELGRALPTTAERLRHDNVDPITGDEATKESRDDAGR